MNEEKDEYLYIFREDPLKIINDEILGMLGDGRIEELLKNVDNTQKAGFLFCSSYISALLNGKMIPMKERNFNWCTTNCDQLQAANQAINTLKWQLKVAKGEVQDD